MRVILQLILASIASGATLRRGNWKEHGIDDDDFIYVNGLRLYDSNGLHYLTGTLRVPLPIINANTDTATRNQLLGLYEPSSQTIRWRELLPSNC